MVGLQPLRFREYHNELCFSNLCCVSWRPVCVSPWEVLSILCSVLGSPYVHDRWPPVPLLPPLIAAPLSAPPRLELPPYAQSHTHRC